MRWLTDLWFRALALVRGSRLDEELQEEIAFHLEMETEKNLAAGIEPEEARRLARRHLGGAERVRLHTRDAWGVRWAQELLLDLRYGLRSLAKTPGVTGASLTILAVALAAATALFSLVDGILLRPLPYPAPERLVAVWETHPERSEKNVVSTASFVDWTERERVFEDLGAYYQEVGIGLTGEGDPLQVTAAMVTPGVLTTLGVDASLGRTFVPEEGEDGDADVVILSDGFWRRRFGADPGILGETVRLDGVEHRVVGVMPPGMAFPTPGTDVWLPLQFSESARNDRKSHSLRVVGRLETGISLEAAEEQMNRLEAALAEEHPEFLSGWGVNLVPLHEETVGQVRPALAVLLGASGLLLLLGCVNVANLLLARSVNRDREIAVRQALGASRSRLIRQLLTESLALGLLGGAAALPMAVWATRSLRALAPAGIPRLEETAVDTRVFAFAFALTLATSLLIGVLPALRSSRTDPADRLHVGPPTSADAGGTRPLDLLVVCEVALSLVLLIGAGLLGRSLWTLSRIDPGFEFRGVLAVSLDLPRSSYAGTAEHLRFYEHALERVRALPGVVEASAISDPPLIGAGTSRSFILEENPERQRSAETVDYRLATDDYFRTLRIPLLEGRVFGPSDRQDSPPVLVVNEAMARRYWPEDDALGRRLAFNAEGPWYEVVGVVGDTRYKDPEAPPPPAMYAPLRQKTWEWMSWMTLLVKTDGDPHTLAEPARQAIWEVDPDLPILATRSVEELAADALSRRRFHTTVFALFAGVALLLGVLGLYGVLAFSVERRRREIGIRMALGARKGSVTRLVLGRGAGLAAAGIALGTVVALGLSQLLAALLYGVRATDPATFVTVALVLGTVALVACLPPLRRALKIDPARVLN